MNSIGEFASHRRNGGVKGRIVTVGRLRPHSKGLYYLYVTWDRIRREEAICMGPRFAVPVAE